MRVNLTIKQLERKLRSTKIYTDWVHRNKALWCFNCNKKQDLECHHIISLYHIMLGFWKLYGDSEEVLKHVTAMHKDDRIECVTLCSDCHAEKHPGRIASESASEIRNQEWVAVPRNWWFKSAQSTKDNSKDHIKLISLQFMFGIGWYILNDRMDGRMITFNRRRFAELIGKTPSTSFNNSFDSACQSLQELDVLAAYYRNHNDVELHVSPNYISRLLNNPWFFPLKEIPTKNMCVLMLRWFLSHQSRRWVYQISLEKLKNNLGLHETRQSRLIRTVQKACEDIRWAGMTYDEGMFNFAIRRKPAIPVFTLRDVLEDCLTD